MPQISPSIPAVGQPNSSEEPKIVSALNTIVGAVNNVDAAMIVDHTITATEIETQQAWQTLTGVGVSNFSYYKDTLGRVHLEPTSIVVGGSSIAPSTTLGTFPVGYRPRVILAFPLYAAGPGTFSAWNVSLGGVVTSTNTLSAGSTYVFMGCSFRAEN